MDSRVRVLSTTLCLILLLLVSPNPASAQVALPQDSPMQLAPSNDYHSAIIGILKYVPAGRFQRNKNETNISVISTPFRMSEHEITRSQFKTIMGIDPSNPKVSSGTADPVQLVNWYHAIAFCNKLSLIEGLVPVYSVAGIDFGTLAYDRIPKFDNPNWNAVTADWSANGYRLPTIAEWRWAAMGALFDDPAATINATGYNKAFSGSSETNKIGDYVWYYINSDFRSSPVGTKQPNELGIYDLSGNISEWCWDWERVDAYPSGTLIDYRGADSGKYRYAAGGNWCFESFECAIDSGFGISPNGTDYYIGFRVVRP